MIAAAASELSAAFVFALALRMVIAALIAVSVTVLAEKAGPVVGGLLATLPIMSGPAYFFLAQNHDAAFISQTAFSTFAQNIPTAIFATCYILLAQRYATFASTASSVVVWCAYLALSLWGDQGFATAVMMSLCVFPLCIILASRYRYATATAREQSIVDLVARGLIVGLLVGAIELLSTVASARWTGVLAAAPVFYLSLMVVLQRRLGGPAASAVIANTIAGFAGTSYAFLAVYLLAPQIGKWPALLAGLAISVSCSGGLLLLHRYGASIRERLAPSGISATVVLDRST